MNHIGILQEVDEQLIDLLATAVELKVGVRPDDDAVADFLNGVNGLRRAVAVAEALPRPTPSMSALGMRTSAEQPRSGTVVIYGKAYHSHSAKDAMVIVLRELASKDDSFLERCSRHPDAQGRKRRYIARTPEELYPDRPDLRSLCESLPGGWLVATNLNNIIKANITKLAADVAGLSFGRDVVVDF